VPFSGFDFSNVLPSGLIDPHSISMTAHDVSQGFSSNGEVALKKIDQVKKAGAAEDYERTYALLRRKLDLSKAINRRIMLPGFAASFLVPAATIEAIHPVFVLLGLHLATDGAKKYDEIYRLSRPLMRAQNSARSKPPISQEQAVQNMQETMKVTALEVTAAGIGSVYHVPPAEQLVTMGAYYLAMTYGTYAIGYGIVKMHETGMNVMTSPLKNIFAKVAIPFADGLQLDEVHHIAGYCLSKAAQKLYRHSSSIGAFAKILTAGRVFNHSSGYTEGLTHRAVHWAGELPVVGGYTAEVLATGGMWFTMGAAAGAMGLVLHKTAYPLVLRHIVPAALEKFGQAAKAKNRAGRAVRRQIFAYRLGFSVSAKDMNREPVPAHYIKMNPGYSLPRPA